ncbi:MAG: DUF4381 domain-containing protein [Granulosicoccus sp.]|nr:DUF4381 domain-containing protein [Granulosicoccus sp.]
MNETEALLAQLRGIHPPAVSQLPAVGWWVLAILALLLLAVVWQFSRRYKRRAWVRQAQTELQQIRENAKAVPVADSLSKVSRLVRRVLLAARPRAEVASLQGDRWLQELDTICGRELFSQGYGRMLESAPYQRLPEFKTSDLHGLFDVVQELIQAAGKEQATGSRS